MFVFLLLHNQTNNYCITYTVHVLPSSPHHKFMRNSSRVRRKKNNGMKTSFCIIYAKFIVTSIEKYGFLSCNYDIVVAFKCTQSAIIIFLTGPKGSNTDRGQIKEKKTT